METSELLDIDKIKTHLSTFCTLECLMKDSIHQIYIKNQEAPDEYGIGWVLRNSIINSKGDARGYLDSLELNLSSIVGKIDKNDLIEYKKRLITHFRGTFPEIQVLGAICRAEKNVQIEKPLPDVVSMRNFDFKISPPDIFIEVYNPFSKMLGEDYHENAEWGDLGEELREKIFKKYDKKNLMNINSSYPVFLIINTMSLVDYDSIQVSIIVDPTSEKYVFKEENHCHGIIFYNPVLRWGQKNMISNCIFSPNCPKELKQEMIRIFKDFR